MSSKESQPLTLEDPSVQILKPGARYKHPRRTEGIGPADWGHGTESKRAKPNSFRARFRKKEEKKCAHPVLF